MRRGVGKGMFIGIGVRAGRCVVLFLDFGVGLEVSGAASRARGDMVIVPRRVMQR